MTNYVPRLVETVADIEKKIEIEAANLMYFDRLTKEEAFVSARKYIEEKYKDVVEKLRHEGKYH